MHGRQFWKNNGELFGAFDDENSRDVKGQLVNIQTDEIADYKWCYYKLPLNLYLLKTQRKY